MKKIILLLLLFITGCFGNYNLENGLQNTREATSLTLETEVIYHASRYTDHRETVIRYQDQFDWQNGRVKRYSLADQDYYYYDVYPDGLATKYGRDYDTEWVIIADNIDMTHDSELNIHILDFIAYTDIAKNRHVPFLNRYSFIVYPQEFFDAGTAFHDVEGELKINIRVSGGYIQEISYELTEEDEVLLTVDINITDINQTSVQFPFSIGSTRRSEQEIFSDVSSRIVRAAKDYYAEQIAHKKGVREWTFVIEDGEFADNTPQFDFSGKLPVAGTIILNETGEVKMAVHNGQYCAKKEYNGRISVEAGGLNHCRLP